MSFFNNFFGNQLAQICNLCRSLPHITLNPSAIAQEKVFLLKYLQIFPSNPLTNNN